MILLIFLIAIPLIEIAVMIKVGQWVGFWSALGLVVATGVAGSMLLARSGLTSAIKVQQAMLRGEPPVAAMLDGALVVMAGVLLITPGFVADALGLSLLLPFVRNFVTGWALRNMVVVGAASSEERRYAERQTGPQPGGDARGNGFGREEPSQGPVIDGEFERLDERPMQGNRRKPDEPPRP